MALSSATIEIFARLQQVVQSTSHHKRSATIEIFARLQQHTISSFLPHRSATIEIFARLRLMFSLNFESKRQDLSC